MKNIIFSAAIGLIVSLFLIGTLKKVLIAEAKVIKNEKNIAVYDTRIKEQYKYVILSLKRIDTKVDKIIEKIYE